MRRTLALAVSLGLCTGCVASKRVAMLDVPAADLQDTTRIDWTALRDKYPDDPGVILERSTAIEHAGMKGLMSNWTFSQVKTETEIIFDPGVTALSTFEYVARPAKFYVRMRFPDGHQRRFDDGDLQETRDADGVVHYVFVCPEVVPGTVVESGSETVFPIHEYVPLQHDIPLQFTVPCEHLVFSYLYPDWWKIDIRSNPRTPPYHTQETVDPENRKAALRYEARDIPALRDEPYTPFFREMANYLQFHVTELSMGQSSYARSKTWGELAGAFRTWSTPRVPRNDMSLQKRLRPLVRDGAQTRDDTVASVLAFVRDSVELVKGSDADDFMGILRERRANASSLTALVDFVLSTFDYDAQLLLLHSATDGILDQQFISLDQFDAVAVLVPDGGSGTLVFPYLKDAPVGYIPPDYLGQPALVVDADHKAHFITLPETSAIPNVSKEHYLVTLDASGHIGVKEERHLWGQQAVEIRRALKDLTSDERRDKLEDYVAFTDGEVDWDSFAVDGLTMPAESLSLELAYSVGDLLTVAPDLAAFETGGLTTPISGLHFDPNPSERQNPVRLQLDESYEKECRIEYPAGWLLKDAPRDTSVANDCGTAQVHYAAGPGYLEINQEVRLNRGDYPRESIAALADLIGARSALLLKTLSFTRSSAGTD